MVKIAPIGEKTLEAEQHGTGHDIRALRKARNITISDLAEQLGRSLGWLSQVERGQAEPSIADIRQIAKLFELPISFFFRNDLAEESERGYVVRAESRASLGSRQSGLVEQLLSPDLSGDFEIIHSTFEIGQSSDWTAARPTQEAGYIVSGSLTLTLRDRSFELKTGDSFQFQNQDYKWRNAGEEPCVVIWVISPPVY